MLLFWNFRQYFRVCKLAYAQHVNVISGYNFLKKNAIWISRKNFPQIFNSSEKNQLINYSVFSKGIFCSKTCLSHCVFKFQCASDLRHTWKALKGEKPDKRKPCEIVLPSVSVYHDFLPHRIFVFFALVRGRWARNSWEFRKIFMQQCNC